MNEIIELVVQLLGYGSIGLVSWIGGHAAAERKNRHQNAAKAECVQCSHETAPRPLSEAMRAAAGHQEATGHRVLVVKA